MPRDQHYLAALKFAREYGFEGVNLPGFGLLEPSRSCPLARACDALVGTDSITFKRGRGQTVALPREVQAFVRLADSGQYRDMLGEPV